MSINFLPTSSRPSLIDGRPIWFQPFTLTLLLAIVSASLFAHDTNGQLDPDVASQVAHAPKHWGIGQWLRLLTSIPFTSDRSHLLAALSMSTICVGTCETMRGTRFTAALFLTVHLATMAILAILFFLSHWLFISHTTQRMLDISDVGPSAGYYGCLGYVLVVSHNKAAVVMRWCVPIYLIGRVAYSSMRPDFEPHTFQTDLAHAIAFALPLFAKLRIRSKS